MTSTRIELDRSRKSLVALPRPGLGARRSNVSVGMRDTAFKEYAATTRRELAGLGKKLHDAIDARSSTDGLMRNQVRLLWSVKRRRSSAPATEECREDHELPAGGPPSIDERTPFARELGDAWVEVEPGIYECAPSPLVSEQMPGRSYERRSPASDRLG